MWIVKLALRRPYTFTVVAILILIMGMLAIFRTPTDIFPNINIPVVSIIWNYNGLVPQQMSDRIVTVTQRALTTTVDNIEYVESQSLYGIVVVRVFLQPNANMQQAIAQIAAISQTQLRQLPAGTTYLFCNWRSRGTGTGGEKSARDRDQANQAPKMRVSRRLLIEAPAAGEAGR